MLNRLKTNNKGFTIIEVMIVLAIAGLIILIVLLAIPALQRNSRNTGIKNDASALAGGFTEFSSNQNGIMPTQLVWNNTGAHVLRTATIANGASVKLQPQTTINTANTGTIAFANRTEPTAAQAIGGNIYVDSGQTCRTAAGAGGNPTRSSRAFAIYYWTETPGVTAGADAVSGIINGAGLKGQCLDS